MSTELEIHDVVLESITSAPEWTAVFAVCPCYGEDGPVGRPLAAWGIEKTIWSDGNTDTETVGLVAVGVNVDPVWRHEGFIGYRHSSQPFEMFIAEQSGQADEDVAQLAN